MPKIKNTATRSRRAAAPKNVNTKPTVLKADYITQSEISAIIQLSDIVDDLAIEVRRRIENGARVQKGHYAAYPQRGGGSPIPEERRHREQCGGLSICGLMIDISPAQRAKKGAAHV